MMQYPRMALLSAQRGHANFLTNLFSTKKPDPNAGKGTPNGGTGGTGGTPMFQGKPIPEGFRLKADNSGLDLADGYELDPTDNTKARKKSTNNPLTFADGLFKMSSDAGDNKPPAFSLDPEALKKLAGNLSFAPQMNEELLAKFKEGDAQAITEILNSSGRNAYATIMQHLPALTEQYVNGRLEHDRKGLGQSVKQTLTQQSLKKLAEGNPVLSQQVEHIGSMLLQKYPDADPDWIAEQTKQYFVETAKLLGANISDGKGGTTPAGDPKDLSQQPGFNWADYITKAPSQSQ